MRPRWSPISCATRTQSGGRANGSPLPRPGVEAVRTFATPELNPPRPRPGRSARDRKSVVSGKGVSVSLDLGYRRIIKKQRYHDQLPHTLPALHELLMSQLLYL